MQYLTAAIASLFFLAQANPLPLSFESEAIRSYCAKHQGRYEKLCSSSADFILFPKLGKFCDAFKKQCVSGKSTATSDSDFILPPSLPRSSDVMLDLPIGVETKPRPSHNQVTMDASIVASCTPDCTAPHCTLECKCANTHQNVYRQCNPPANAAIAMNCINWYQKCYMFKPLQY